MPAIIWDASMSTGVQALDDQHKQVIAWLNDLLAAMLQGKGHAEIEGLLDQINSYTAAHFRHEEDCMARYKCPAAHKDAADHARISKVLGALNAEFERDGATAHLAVLLQTEGIRLFVGHIRRIDTQLYPCVRALEETA